MRITKSQGMVCLALVGLLALGTTSLANHMHTSSKFEGPKANTGTVSHSKQGNMNVLTLSEDFVVPDTPAPHWQVVDSKGNTFLLNRLKIKGDKINRTMKRLGHATVDALPAVSADARKRSSGDLFRPPLLVGTVLCTAAYFFHITTFY